MFVGVIPNRLAHRSGTASRRVWDETDGPRDKGHSSRKLVSYPRPREVVAILKSALACLRRLSAVSSAQRRWSERPLARGRCSLGPRPAHGLLTMTCAGHYGVNDCGGRPPPRPPRLQISWIPSLAQPCYAGCVRRVTNDEPDAA